MLRCLVTLLIPSVALVGAEWSWTWKPAAGAAAPRAEVCPFKYGFIALVYLPLHALLMYFFPIIADSGK